MSSKFKPGQTVYTLHGSEAVYVGLVSDGLHAVRLSYDFEDEYGDTHGGYDVVLRSDVFAAPPVERYDAEIAERKAAIEELSSRAEELRREIAEHERNKAELQRAAEKYPSIQQALDFFEGRITHLVDVGYRYKGASYAALEDALSDESRWGGAVRKEGVKLLCLFGADNCAKKTRWKVNQYRDGSSSNWKEIIPAHSEEDARAYIRDAVEAELEHWRTGGEKPRLTFIKDTFALNPWLIVPDDLAAHIAAEERFKREKRAAELKAELAEIERGVK